MTKGKDSDTGRVKARDGLLLALTMELGGHKPGNVVSLDAGNGLLLTASKDAWISVPNHKELNSASTQLSKRRAPRGRNTAHGDPRGTSDRRDWKSLCLCCLSH